MISVLLILLFVKHFYADFVNQPPYMYLNKGNWKHPGGYLHAFHHIGWTCLFLLPFVMTHILSFGTMILLLLAEFVIHYLMDFCKVNICKYKGYGPTTHEEWFWWLGFDQLVHCLTYVMIAGVVFNA